MESHSNKVLRRELVRKQRDFENRLTKSIIDGDVECSVVVIHTNLPSTPLCVDSLNVDSFAKVLPRDVLDDEEELKLVTDRSSSLRGYLQAKGGLFMCYRSPREYMDEYEKVAKKHKENLSTIRLSEENKTPSGATYLLQKKDGSLVFFSIESNQSSFAVEHSRVWYGSFNAEELLKDEVEPDSEDKREAKARFVKIRSCLSGVISFEEELNKNRVLISGYKKSPEVSVKDPSGEAVEKGNIRLVSKL